MTDWRSRAIAIKTEDSPNWRVRALSVSHLHDPPSQAETLGRSSLNALTLGFDKVGAGVIGAAYDQHQGSTESYGDLYRKNRDEWSERFKESEKENPKTAIAGQVIGSLPLAVVPGSGALKTVALTSAMGLGNSDADLTKGELGQAATDTALGGVVGGITHGVGHVIAPYISRAGNSATKVIGTGAKKAISAVLGPSEEAIEARLAGKAQDSALSYPELAEKMKGSLSKLSDQISDHNKAAWETLNPDNRITYGGVPKEEVLKAVNQETKKLLIQDGLVGHADAQAEQVLHKLGSDIDQLSDGISEKDLKRIIQKLDDNINWDSQSASKTNEALSSLRTGLKTILEQNESYRDAMKPVSERTALLNDLKRLFNFKNESGHGLVPTDTTASKIKMSLNENKAVTQDKLNSLKNFVGEDYSALAKDYDLARQFQGGHANGSRRVNLGAATGGALGFFGGATGAGTGAALGAMLGAHIDKEGGTYAGKLIDWYVKHDPGKLGKFATPLVEAMNRGPGALAATHYVLQQRDPEYRDHLKNISPDQN